MRGRLAAAWQIALLMTVTTAGCVDRQPVETPGSAPPVTAEDARARMRDVLLRPGVSYLAADPACACAVVGVVDDGGAAEARRFARDAGLPDAAVRVTRSPSIVPHWWLRDGIRPIKGGLQVNNGAGAMCTMFGTVFHRARQAKGLLTNAHCTATRFAVDGTQFYQAGGVIGDFVAREVLDPPALTTTSDPRCPAGASCRLSDAVFAQFATSTVGIVGRVARTDHPCLTGPCTLEMSANDPAASLPVTGAGDAGVVAGTRVSKIGRTTGWTVGTVSAVCADVTVGGLPAGATPIVMLCQTLVTGVSDFGDSGSPVFTSRTGFVDAHYVGILWGGSDGTGTEDTFVYSPLTGVEAELGAFDYHE